jgi:hypothetical protein
VQEDVHKLLENMKALLPNVDSMDYASRLKRLDWSKLAFDHFTPEECKTKWKEVSAKVY